MYKVLGLFMVSLLVGTGCINKATGFQSPGFSTKNINSLYVVKHSKDSHNVNELIKTELETRGFSVDTGSEENVPGHIDGLVNYTDKWMWDITMYMMELSISLTNPETNFPIARGNSLHSSLTRKSPQEMVEEVIGNMLGEENKANGGDK